MSIGGWDGRVTARALRDKVERGIYMTANRIFLPQEALDAWLVEGKISLEDDLLTLGDGSQLRLTAALRVLEEVAEGKDPHGLVGKVKTLEEIVGMSGEHCADSVILGDNAYQVAEGFLGEPVAESASGKDGDPFTRWFAEQ